MALRTRDERRPRRYTVLVQAKLTTDQFDALETCRKKMQLSQSACVREVIMRGLTTEHGTHDSIPDKLDALGELLQASRIEHHIYANDAERTKIQEWAESEAHAALIRFLERRKQRKDFEKGLANGN